jgi:hypothetical protein
MDNSEKYYLSSLESYELEIPRECVFLKKVPLSTGKGAIIAKISPPVLGQQFALTTDIDYVVLTHRHEGYSLFPITKFPCFVFVARPLVENILDFDSLNSSQLEVIAWAELYRTEADAINHVFDK